MPPPHPGRPLSPMVQELFCIWAELLVGRGSLVNDDFVWEGGKEWNLSPHCLSPFCRLELACSHGKPFLFQKGEMKYPGPFSPRLRTSAMSCMPQNKGWETRCTAWGRGTFVVFSCTLTQCVPVQKALRTIPICNAYVSGKIIGCHIFLWSARRHFLCLPCLPHCLFPISEVTAQSASIPCAWASEECHLLPRPGN